MRLVLVASLALLCAARLAGAEPPASVEVTLEPQKFGDVSAILKVDSTVASFKFDQPVTYLALVIEAFPKEPQRVPVARLALEFTKPVTEGRFCVQMADQGFLPLGNGAPHQMQLFLQLDCGGTLISSSQSFLKEKFTFSKSLARSGSGVHQYKVTNHRAPAFWLMGNSDNGTYFNDDDLDKVVMRNRDAYVLIAYLETSKNGQTPVLAQASSAESVKVPSSAASIVASATLAATFIGPPFPVPAKADTKATSVSKSEIAAATKSGSSKSKAPSSSSSKKKKKRS